MRTETFRFSLLIALLALAAFALAGCSGSPPPVEETGTEETGAEETAEPAAGEEPAEEAPEPEAPSEPAAPAAVWFQEKKPVGPHFRRHCNSSRTLSDRNHLLRMQQC